MRVKTRVMWGTFNHEDVIVGLSYSREDAKYGLIRDLCGDYYYHYAESHNWETVQKWGYYISKIRVTSMAEKVKINGSDGDDSDDW